MIGPLAAAFFGLLVPLQGQSPTAQFVVTSASGALPAGGLRELRNDFSARLGPSPPQIVTGEDLLALGAFRVLQKPFRSLAELTQALWQTARLC